jgi:eukaryotic-like serine/threonine-protein kinase
MSSGELPQEVYHRSGAIGAGSYGSVMTAYNDEGEEFALKVFADDADEDDEDGIGGIPLGALREISILRILRESNAHPNIIAIHDVQTTFGEDDDVGNAVGGRLALTMPLYQEGTLAGSFSKIISKKQKAVIAHGILSAVAYLHSNYIIHRDIKSDNILLETTTDDSGEDLYHAVLIDFSLAKITRPECVMGTVVDGLLPSTDDGSDVEGTTHTPSVGTPTYRAPEVVAEEPYGLASDLWSVGVVLLEMLRGKEIEALKDKGATALINEYVSMLPLGQPFPTLIRGLLQPDPTKRWTAYQALQCPLFQKFDLPEPSYVPIYLPLALALDCEADFVPESGKLGAAISTLLAQGKENNNFIDPTTTSQGKKKIKKGKVDSKLVKRWRIIEKICNWMEWSNPLTAHAAMTYSRQMEELLEDEEDIHRFENLEESQILLDCVVLAHKFFEHQLSTRDSVDELYLHFAKEEFDSEEYCNNESTILMLMDFCLYPRVSGQAYIAM